MWLSGFRSSRRANDSFMFRDSRQASGLMGFNRSSRRAVDEEQGHMAHTKHPENVFLRQEGRAGGEWVANSSGRIRTCSSCSPNEQILAQFSGIASSSMASSWLLLVLLALLQFGWLPMLPFLLLSLPPSKLAGGCPSWPASCPTLPAFPPLPPGP